MGGIIDRMKKQWAIIWPFTGNDRHGVAQFGPAIETKCRWDDSVVLYTTIEGETKASTAVVYPAEFPVLKSRMKKGRLVDLTDPKWEANTEVYEVKQRASTPNLRATQTLYTVYLG